MEHVIHGYKKMKYFSLQMCNVSLLLSMPSKELLQYDPQTIIRDTDIYALFNIWKIMQMHLIFEMCMTRLQSWDYLFLVRLYKSVYLVWFIVCQSRVAVNRRIFRLEKKFMTSEIGF